MIVGRSPIRHVVVTAGYCLIRRISRKCQRLRSKGMAFDGYGFIRWLVVIQHSTKRTAGDFGLEELLESERAKYMQ